MSEIRPVPQVYSVRRVVPCQGRSCDARATCAHYYARPLEGREVLARLCEPGKDQPEPIGVVGSLLQVKKP